MSVTYACLAQAEYAVEVCPPAALNVAVAVNLSLGPTHPPALNAALYRDVCLLALCLFTKAQPVGNRSSSGTGSPGQTDSSASQLRRYRAYTSGMVQLVRDLTKMRQCRRKALLLCHWPHHSQLLLGVRIDRGLDSLTAEQLMQLTDSGTLDDSALTCSVEAAAVWRVGMNTATQVHNAAIDSVQAGLLTIRLNVDPPGSLLLRENLRLASC